MSTTRIAFPPGFAWGAATSACQIEGSPLDDGAGPSLRHEFCRRPGRIRDGSRCTGFFCWTLMDSFEWSNGLAARFALVRVDFATRERRPRASARWYRDVAADNAVTV